MAARVIQFGFDDCYRVRVLQREGYQVEQVHSLDELARRVEQADAVILSESHQQEAEQAGEIARTRSMAPVILFRGAHVFLDVRNFDRVYEWTVEPRVWLDETAELIARSWAIREQSVKLRKEAQQQRADAAAVRAETRRQRAQLEQELARNKADSVPDPF